MNFIKIAAFSMAAAAIVPSQASSLVYEGFNYGLSDGMTMDGVAINATGLTGNYAQGQSLAGLGSALYASTGLTFGSNFLPVTGGALTMSITSNINNTTRSTQLGATLNTGAITGTVYTSYLFSYGSSGSPAGTSQMRINGAQTTTSNPHLTVLADGSVTRSNGIAYGSESVVNGPSNTLTLNTTYLALAKFTNLGTVGSVGTGEMWVFTEAGYNDWLNLGMGLEENLVTYAVPGSYLTTSTTTTANNSTVDDSQFLSFAVSNANNVSAQAVTIDEARWGTTLGDVVAVPEPGAALLFAMGISFCGMAALRRRNSPLMDNRQGNTRLR